MLEEGSNQLGQLLKPVEDGSDYGLTTGGPVHRELELHQPAAEYAGYGEEYVSGLGGFGTTLLGFTFSEAMMGSGKSYSRYLSDFDGG